AGKLLRKARLANAGFAADVDRETGLAVPAAGKRTLDLAEFGTAANERPYWCFGGIDKAEELPDVDQLRQPCDLDLRQPRGAGPIGQDPLHSFGHQDFPRLGPIG